MAQKMKKRNQKVQAPARSNLKNDKKKSAAELQEWFNKNKQHIENYAAAKQAAKQLRDITKTSTKSINTFSKETLRTYLQSIGSNEKNLRNLSWYLYYRSQTYARLVNFYANMFCLDARSVVPEYDLVKGGDVNKTLKSYQDTLLTLDKMHLQQEFYNIYLTCFVQDVFYGIYITDETGVFIYPIPADYAKISGKYLTGDFAFALDCTYLRSRQELLEYMPEPFETLYREYESTGQKWQPVPDEFCICLKYRSEDFETILAPLVACFNAFINLADLEDIQAIADEQEIYKLLYIPLETLGEEVDDWKVDPSLVQDYFKRLQDAIPSYADAAIIPGKLEEISFNSDQATDTTKVSKATETVLNTAGGAEILNGSTISGAEAFRYAQIANTEYAISSLLPQTQAVVNRLISYEVSKPAKVKFFPISVYTKGQFKKDLLESATYGLPTKLALNALNGFSEMDTLALNFLEEEVLQLSTKLVPLQSTHTQSGNDTDDINATGGRAKSEEPTDTGDESAEKRDKAKG